MHIFLSFAGPYREIADRLAVGLAQEGHTVFFDRDDLPFYFVQLANIHAPRDEPIESHWAEMQWAQLLSHRTTPHTGIAVINDGSDGNPAIVRAIGTPKLVPYLGAMLWERVTPQFPFYIPVVATLLLIPIVWFRFKLQADPLPDQP